MTKKEVHFIAWVLTEVTDINMDGAGKYGPQAELANAALEIVEKLQKEYPCIKEEMELLEP